MPEARLPLTPTRIASLDVLRGFALLGILLINVQSFGLPSFAYLISSDAKRLGQATSGIY